MRKIVLLLYIVFAALSLGGCVKTDTDKQSTETVLINNESAPFEIADFSKYQGVAVKTFVASDSRIIGYSSS